jgi:hypothetical protein
MVQPQTIEFAPQLPSECVAAPGAVEPAVIIFALVLTNAAERDQHWFMDLGRRKLNDIMDLEVIVRFLRDLRRSSQYLKVKKISSFASQP